MSASSEKILQDLGPRQAIARAVAILMDTHQVSEEAALDMLVRHASESHGKIRDTARRIVAESQRS
jgi:AmiR/NasT family two-component response regulator